MVEGLAPHAFLSGLIPGHSPSSRNLAGEMSLSCNDSSSSLNLADSAVRALLDNPETNPTSLGNARPGPGRRAYDENVVSMSYPPQVLF